MHIENERMLGLLACFSTMAMSGAGLGLELLAQNFCYFITLTIKVKKKLIWHSKPLMFKRLLKQLTIPDEMMTYNPCVPEARHCEDTPH